MTQESIESNFTSMHPTVEFLDILDLYSFDADLHCKFKLNDYTPKEGDRVAIFKIGWNLVKDYVVFEWAPIDTNNGQASVIFNKHILPKNSTEVYQICYISCENELHGASTPFQFDTGVNLMTLSAVSFPNSLTKAQSTIETAKDQEISRLKEENNLLKESLKALLLRNKETPIKNYDKDIEDLKKLTESLNNMLLQHQSDIELLKTKLKDCGEEYKKLYLEKLKIEKKYDKLKNRNDKRTIDEGKVDVVPDFDIGELKSMPPFPSIK